MKFPTLVIVCSAAMFLGSGGYTLLPSSLTSRFANAFDPSCTIKGNVSIDTGERIYHVPGQHYYEATKISFRYGERWFCSEEEARAAGWRKAGY
ncbi:hypothetical protein G6L86_18880 [Agrobacterium tumefaciens]|uniref:sunset domain-containing protein n=1 Tax=Agrobacterium tumefaciens TaxID=358 RepID=UPI001572ACFE|nr:hypothetical protein [Agrobacterium tumefaciens]NSX87672.1 hypothetical protein [Agrobacterium tumefaciens]